MKLHELRKIIDTYDNQHENEDYDVAVVVSPNELSIGKIPTSTITHVCMGCDWNAGKILVITEDKIIKKKEC